MFSSGGQDMENVRFVVLLAELRSRHHASPAQVPHSPEMLAASQRQNGRISARKTLLNRRTAKRDHENLRLFKGLKHGLRIPI